LEKKEMIISWLFIVLLAALAVYDLYRVYKKQPTISRLYHDLLPNWIDKIILVIVGFIVWWLFGGSETFAPWAIGVVAGHLLWYDRN